MNQLNQLFVVIVATISEYYKFKTDVLLDKHLARENWA